MINSSNPLNILPRVDGMYVAPYYMVNKITGVGRSIQFLMFFNSYGLVLAVDTSEVENQNDMDVENLKSMLCEFANLTEYGAFENIAKYNIGANKINMKFFEPDNGMAYENDIINENHYFRWEGEITSKGLILSRFDSFLIYNLQRYVEDNTIMKLKFTFVPVNF